MDDDEFIEESELEGMIKEKSELRQVFDSLDDDQIKKDRMSNIDFNTRLTGDEISMCLVIDELVKLGVLPEEIAITRQKKRLSVSRNGMGREEKVKMVTGDREMKSGISFSDRMSGLFKRRE